MFNPDKPLLITDIETGGIPVSAPIIQIAAIAFIPRTGEILDEFEQKLQFNVADCAPEALGINHYTPEAWVGAVPTAQALKDLAAVYSRHAVSARKSKKGGTYKVAIGGGYNSGFDSERLFHRARQNNIFLPVDPRFLDVMQLALWKLDLESYKLTSVAEYLGVEVENAHDALADVKLTAAVMQELLTF